MKPRKLHNVDAAERVNLLRTVLYSLVGSLIAGAVGTWRFGLYGLVVGAVGGWLFVFGLMQLLLKGSAAAAATIYAPSGSSTPHKREYSYPQSLALRGRYAEAITAYEACCAEFPADPEPYLRIARLYRDELQRFDDALAWFRRARSDASLEAALEKVVTQEIIEVYTYRLAQPRRAMPELARLAERFPGSKEAEWAGQRLRELRQEIAQGEPG